MSGISDIKEWSDQTILEKIGAFIKQRRIQRQLTQKQLSERAAMSRSTLSLIERGENSTLLNLIKVLRILDALYVLKEFERPEMISPLHLAKQEQKKRQRASGKKSSKNEELGW